MNEFFMVIFGIDYEGEDASSIRIFNNLDQLDDIIIEQPDSYDYYKLGLIDSNGKVVGLTTVDIKK